MPPQLIQAIQALDPDAGRSSKKRLPPNPPTLTQLTQSTTPHRSQKNGAAPNRTRKRKRSTGGEDGGGGADRDSDDEDQQATQVYAFEEGSSPTPSAGSSPARSGGPKPLGLPTVMPLVVKSIRAAYVTKVSHKPRPLFVSVACHQAGHHVAKPKVPHHTTFPRTPQMATQIIQAIQALDPNGQGPKLPPREVTDVALSLLTTNKLFFRRDVMAAWHDNGFATEGTKNAHNDALWRAQQQQQQQQQQGHVVEEDPHDDDDDQGDLLHGLSGANAAASEHLNTASRDSLLPQLRDTQAEVADQEGRLKALVDRARAERDSILCLIDEVRALAGGDPGGRDKDSAQAASSRATKHQEECAQLAEEAKALLERVRSSAEQERRIRGQLGALGHPVPGSCPDRAVQRSEAALEQATHMGQEAAALVVGDLSLALQDLRSRIEVKELEEARLHAERLVNLSRQLLQTRLEAAARSVRTHLSSSVSSP